MQLLEVYQDAQQRGFLGPEPVQRHIEHGRNLARALGDFSGRFLDLGSGAGVPGLVLAEDWPASSAVLLDSQRRRCAFLLNAVAMLGVAGRVDICCGRAEELARTPELRGAFDLVVARGFARPAVTAECAVGFLRVDGRLVVSDPPDRGLHGRVSAERWPEDGLRALGLGPARTIRAGSSGAVCMVAERPPLDPWPRRIGRPAKSPLW